MNFSPFERKISNIYIEFNHSNKFKVLYSQTIYIKTPPSVVLTAQTVYQNLRQIEWLGPL
jgi:hypothetical protein